jgi:hypothetical protein
MKAETGDLPISAFFVLGLLINKIPNQPIFYRIIRNSLLFAEDPHRSLIFYQLIFGQALAMFVLLGSS